nr:reverse transcriptase domain-containing protein [Tanacetum cinerariifolium]
MITRNAGRRTAATRGRRMGGQTGRGGGRTGEKTCKEDDRNAKLGNGRNGCSYKEFVACKPKEFDSKGGVVAYIRWVEKMEAVQDISGCGDNQKVKHDLGNFKTLMKAEYFQSNEMKRLEAEFWGHSMVGVGHAVYTDRFHELARMVVAIKSHTIQNVILKAEVLTDETVRNGSLEMTGERIRDGGESSKEAMAIEGGQGCGNNGNLTSGRAFVMGEKEAHQDPNTMTGTFSLNNYYAKMLSDSSADYSFVSTTFMPLLDVKPSSLGFSYEIEIARKKLVEINKVIRDCKLEIEGHTFDIDLISVGHESFSVIIGMDWLSIHRAKIICHERVVQIPLPHGEMHRTQSLHIAWHLLKWRICQTNSRNSSLRVSFGQVHRHEEHRVCRPYLYKFVIVFIDNILINSKTKEEHETHLRLILDLRKKEKLYAMFSKFEFWLRKVQFLWHVVNSDGIHVDPNKIEAIKNWKAPNLPIKVCSFLELFSNQDCKIRYYTGKGNVVVDALGAQNEACEVVNASAINAVKARRTDGA